MPSTLPKTENLRQHPVVQTLIASFTRYQTQFLPPDSSHVDHENLPHFWLCCSGGRDSLGLAYAFALVRDFCLLPNTVSLKVIHINHHLQQPAQDWQNHVQKFCKANHFAFVSKSVQLPQHANELHARNARFDAIYQCIKPNDILILGHHADDQAETVLMNLCKGAGISGLSGMKECDLYQPHHQHSANREHSALNQQHWRWRPWLSVTRAQITDFCQQAQLSFIDDPTNLAGDNTRAFLRREIMPKLHEKWRSASANIARSARILTENKTIIDAQLQADIEQVLGCVDQQELALNTLNELPQARQNLLVHSWLQGRETYAPPQHICQQIMTLANANQTDIADTHTQITWQNWQIKRYDNLLYRLPLQLQQAGTQHICITKEALNTQHILHLASGKWQAVYQHSTVTKHGLSINLLEKPLTLRAVHAGERLHIHGRVGTWAVKKFFQSIRLPSWQRKQAQILSVGNEPVALLCHKGLFYVESSYLCSNENAWSLILQDQNKST